VHIRNRILMSVFCVVVLGLSGLPWVSATDTPTAGTPTAGSNDCEEAYAGFISGGPGSACVNIILGSADAPPLDVSVDGTQILTNRPYADDVVTKLFVVSSGKVRIQAVPTGESLDKALLDKRVSIAPGGVYDIVLYDAAAEMKVRAFRVDVSVLAANTSRARVINTSKAAGTIDAYLSQNGATPDPNLATGPIKYGRYSAYLEITWQPGQSSLSVFEAASGSEPDPQTGHGAYGGPGQAVSFILVGVSNGIPTWVTTSWKTIPAT